MKTNLFNSRSWLSAVWAVGAGVLAVACTGQLVHASLVADWNASSLSTGALTAGNTWTDSVNSISATAAGTGLSVNNSNGQFNGHNYISFGGAGNFGVAAGTLAQPTSDYSITVVFDTTTTNNAGDFSGNNDWYNANGLVGNEQPGIQTDWGFGLADNSQGVVLGEGNPTANTDQEDRANFTYTGGNTIIATATRDSSTGAVTIFINGVDVAQSYLPSGTTTMDTADRNTSTGFLIGAMDQYNPIARYFSGNIAEVRMFNSVVNGTNEYNSLATYYGLQQVATPEPATFGLCASGAMGLLLLKRRKMA